MLSLSCTQYFSLLSKLKITQYYVVQSAFYLKRIENWLLELDMSSSKLSILQPTFNKTCTVSNNWYVIKGYFKLRLQSHQNGPFWPKVELLWLLSTRKVANSSIGIPGIGNPNNFFMCTEMLRKRHCFPRRAVFFFYRLNAFCNGDSMLWHQHDAVYRESQLNSIGIQAWLRGWVRFWHPQ